MRRHFLKHQLLHNRSRDPPPHLDCSIGLSDRMAGTIESMKQCFYPLRPGSKLFLTSIVFVVLSTSVTVGATLPADSTETQFGSSLSGSPTAMAFAPDGRLFVCLQTGQVRIIKNGLLLATPFLSLSV